MGLAFSLLDIRFHVLGFVRLYSFKVEVLSGFRVYKLQLFIVKHYQLLAAAYIGSMHDSRL